jgi:hypothetical protein
MVFSVSFWCLFSPMSPMSYEFIYLFLCHLVFFIFVVLEFLECLLYFLVDHV